jgi:hypothetical protein
MTDSTPTRNGKSYSFRDTPTRLAGDGAYAYEK